MMRNLVNESGVSHSKTADVVDLNGIVLHFGILPKCF